MKAIEERKKLEGLLNNMPDDIGDDSPEMDSEITQEPVLNINFEDIREKCNYEARVMLNNSIKVFLNDDMMDDEYVKNKLDVDVMSLSGMIYQLRMNEDMQKAIMKEVDKGMINTKFFEEFTRLSRMIADLNKQLLATVEAIKSTYKDLKNDFKEKQHELSAALTELPELGMGTGPEDAPAPEKGMMTTNDGSYITMGTKDVIRRLRQQSREGKTIVRDITDISEVEE